jgi:hypothetical protein
MAREQSPVLYDMLRSLAGTMLRNFLFRNVSEEFMGCVSETLEVNWVLEENGPNNSMARYCIPHTNTDRVRGNFMGCMGIFRPPYPRSRDSAVGIATAYVDNRGVGVRVQVGSRIFTSPCRADRLWGPPSFLSNG